MAVRPKWLRPVAIVAALWNLLGCLAFAQDLRVSPSDLAHMSLEQQQAYAARPMWSVAATGVAVIGGLLGSIALAQPHRIAWPLLAASLIGVIVQDVGLVMASGGVLGTMAIVLQGMVLVIAIVLAMLAHRYAAGLPKD
ncbi:hypothetical protein DWG18_08175 [Lysobacter sp. TY2-98]|uniref:hypothetical protein n=1 Tax=Lysobacter sp. TY2-98 TaxID=2290922 RepID=UPI000E20717B|nr:hypothetical protein [Lysobacter sp. TY2-98]AXK72259.1 hypothetical protein DWG18_08175 [Lysobacter sp. TY2-98]